MSESMQGPEEAPNLNVKQGMELPASAADVQALMTAFDGATSSTHGFESVGRDTADGRVAWFSEHEGEDGPGERTITILDPAIPKSAGFVVDSSGEVSEPGTYQGPSDVYRFTPGDDEATPWEAKMRLSGESETDLTTDRSGVLLGTLSNLKPGLRLKSTRHEA